MRLVLNSNPQLTASEIRMIVLEARQQQEEEGNPIKTPETERVVAYWVENRPQMVKRLRFVSPDAAICLASRLWDKAMEQANQTVQNFPTFNEAMEVAMRDNLLMDPEDESADAPTEPAAELE